MFQGQDTLDFALSHSRTLRSAQDTSRAQPFKPPTSSGPPFALDFNPYATIESNTVASGYRKGGPKEARLHRVTLMKSEREKDHLYPIKIKGINEKVSPEKIKAVFSKYEGVEDVYVPMNLSRNKPAQDFAIVRFAEPEIVDEILRTKSHELLPDGTEVEIQPLQRQHSTFSQSTGALGITNEAFDDGKVPPKVGFIPQAITLDECLSRSGYPWGSKQELKLLEPHCDKEINYLHAIKLFNLNTTTSPESIQLYFSKYGSCKHCYAPVPLQVNLRTKDKNQGYAFIRFEDLRDLKVALKDLQAGIVIIDGNVITGTYQQPFNWPSEKTRRFY
jgi:RNA recognition motif-containing protein